MSMCFGVEKYTAGDMENYCLEGVSMAELDFDHTKAE